MTTLLMTSALLVLHLDFNSVQMRKDVVKDHLREAAAAGYNAVLWEVEDKIRWETCPECVRSEAFTKDEFREILAEADRLGLQPIPLLQTFGHAEYVLAHKPYDAWREMPWNPSVYCVSKPEVRAFLRRFLTEYLDLFGPKVRYFHLGGDEARGFGECPVCAKREPVDLYVEHLNAMADVLRARGVKPCIWCDMMLSGQLQPPELRARVARFPKDVLAWYWDYYHGASGGNITLWANRLDYLTEAGFGVVLAPAAASCGDSPFLPLYRRHVANAAALADLARERKMAGLCLTSWSVHLSPKCLQYPIWELAARRFRAPGASVEADLDAILKRRLGGVDARTLEELTDWNPYLQSFDSRFAPKCGKCAQPQPAGTAQRFADEATRNFWYRLPTADELRVNLKKVARALEKIERIPDRAALAPFAEGARLVLAQGEAIAQVIEGTEPKPLDAAALAAFYGREQAPGSATNCAKMIREPLLWDETRKVISLSGTGWTCDGEPVAVPHTWNAQDACDGPGTYKVVWGGVRGGDSASGKGYLRKRAHYSRALPNPKPGKRYFLKFEGASVVTDVRVNGRDVGRHLGAFTAFAFEVTPFLRPEGPNVLDVWVDNRVNMLTQPMSADYSVYGGIYRDVALIETAPVCIDCVTDGADGVVVEPDPKTGEVTVRVAVLGGTNEVQRFKVENHELWSPENPVLYHRTVRIAQGGSADSVDITFGFRTFEFRDGLFYLNGKRRQLHGVCRHQDRAGKGWAVSAEDEKEDVRLMKEMGADALRTAHYPQSRRIYDLCDRAGLVCWVEYPNVNRLTLTPEYEAAMRVQLREMVAQHRNHPCVAQWGTFNELYNGEQWMRPRAAEVNAMMARVRDCLHELDPSRTVVGVMGQIGHWSLNAIPDEFGSNVYPRWYSDLDMREMLDWLFVETGRKTLAISEYGVGASIRQHGNPATRYPPAAPWHPEEYQAYRMHDNLLALEAEPRVWGTYVWAMFDFGADNRREGDRHGINDKGLVTYDRKTLKDAYYLYRAHWTKTPTLHLVGTRLTATTNETVAVLGFSNVGDVTLRVNGRDCGTRKPDAANGVLWADVKLAEGENGIELSSGEHKASAVWKRTGFIEGVTGGNQRLTPD